MADEELDFMPFYQGIFVESQAETPHRSAVLDITTVYAGDRFPGCSRPPVHLLTLDPGAFPELPAEIRALGPLQILHTACRGCNAWLLNGEQRWAEMGYELLPDGRARPLEPERYPTSCRAEAASQLPQKTWGVRFELAPEGYNPVDNALTVGGEPVWLQPTPGWGICRRCAQGGFFLAHVDALRTPPGLHLQDQVLYVFVCAGCRVLIITTQLT